MCAFSSIEYLITSSILPTGMLFYILCMSIENSKVRMKSKKGKINHCVAKTRLQIQVRQQALT